MNLKDNRKNENAIVWIHSIENLEYNYNIYFIRAQLGIERFLDLKCELLTYFVSHWVLFDSNNEGIVSRVGNRVIWNVSITKLKINHHSNEKIHK